MSHFNSEVTVRPSSGLQASLHLQWQLFLTAIAFFTRLPVPSDLPYSPDRLNRSALFFPLVGVVVALFCAVAFALAHLILPLSLAVLVSMAVSVRLTGAFHEDGWADSCDALGSAFTREDALRIMKDSRIGTYGAVGLFFMLSAKGVALFELARMAPEGEAAWVIATVLLVAHPLSRWVSTALIHIMPYVRDDESGKSKPLAQALSQRDLAIASAFGLAPLLLLPMTLALLLVGIALLMLWRAFVFLNARLGGYTGDTLGATQQLCELLLYLGCVVAWNSI
jgi:adenosylcobinamide-GDP ribazoletransferase